MGVTAARPGSADGGPSTTFKMFSCTVLKRSKNSDELQPHQHANAKITQCSTQMNALKLLLHIFLAVPINARRCRVVERSIWLRCPCLPHRKDLTTQGQPPITVYISAMDNM